MYTVPPEEKFQLGVLFTDANPTDKLELQLELVTALEVIAKYALDQIVYVVNDGRYTDARLEASRKQRWELAKKTCEKYEPLISISDIGIINKEPETVVMANGQSRLRVDPEDLVFHLFQLNSDGPLKLVFITTDEHCRRRTRAGDDDAINKFLSNMKDRLHGFDPSVHQVMVVFIGSLTELPQSLTFEADEQALLDSGIFSIDFMAPGGTMPRHLGGRSREVVKKGAIPFKTFCGYLKQHAHDDLSELEQELFDLLFPAFQGTDENDKAYASATAAFEAWKQDPEKAAQLSKISLVSSERRQRRFSGYGLPRSRYFSVCADAEGADFQTLAHELRAYRDPIDIGMVEVLDLAEGAILKVGQETIQLEREQAIAVLIHRTELVPAALKKLTFRRLPGLQKDREIFLYRFPYRVRPCTVERTIDLRWPEVRDWFYHRFREPTERSAAHQVIGDDTVTPTIAHSRFHFENGKPPVPSDFWEMLPTLVNPDLGGGREADAGSTMLMIGNWMRQNSVGALIYPSARCDCTVEIEHNELTHWEGWNLVDYHDAKLSFGQHPQTQLITTIIHNDWAWQSFPSGVKLHLLDEPSELASSFKISGMVNYWAQDYLDQLRALEIARARHGQEPERSVRTEETDGLASRAFEIGTLIFSWMRRLVEGEDLDSINECVLELQGLAIPYRMYPITGRIVELLNEIRDGRQQIISILNGALQTADLVVQFLKNNHPGCDLHSLARLGAYHELSLLMLSQKFLQKAGSKSILDNEIVQMVSIAEENLTTRWLNEALQSDIRNFYTRIVEAVLEGHKDTANLLKEGVRLRQLTREHLLQYT